MTINQLSVFIENKSGTLLKVLRLLKEANIQIIASTIADTVDYGICRIICAEPKRGYLVLKDAGVATALSGVFAVELDNTPGMAADAIGIFAKDKIEIAYLYSFLVNGKGVLIFRTDNAERAERLIEENHLNALDEKDLLSLTD